MTPEVCLVDLLLTRWTNFDQTLVAELTSTDGKKQRSETIIFSSSGALTFVAPSRFMDHEFRLRANGEILEISKMPNQSLYYVRLKPEHVMICLGEYATARHVAAMLMASTDIDVTSAWTRVLELLDVTHVVALAVENPAFARYLPPAAAALYATEHSMLKEAWELL